MTNISDALFRVDLHRVSSVVVVLVLTSSMVDASQIYFGSQPLDDALGPITFNEVNLGTENPIYTLEDIPQFGDLTVSFGSIFEGQELGPIENSLSVTQPTNPLTLDEDGPTVATMLDLKSSSPPVLGGADGGRYFTIPLAIHFDRAVQAVSFKLGSFDGPDTTFVEIFDATGKSLAITQNISDGFETISARSAISEISGVSIYVTDPVEDWEGFGLDNLAVQVPEPAANTICLWLLVSVGCLIRLRSTRRI